MQTPYEINGRKATRAEGEAFLSDLAAANTTVTLHSYGSSVLGNPMTVATVGTGPVKVVVISSIHASEPAGREAAFIMLRDLVETTDPTLLAYLSTAAWSFMCTANPDNIDAGVRYNINGIDLNRDYAAQTQPETQAIAAWLTAVSPVLLLDLHETVNGAIPDTALAVTTNTGVDPALVTRSTALRNVVADALTAAGNGVVSYPFDTATTGTSLTEGGRIWKCTTLTFEAQQAVSSGKTLAQRVAEQLIAVTTTQSDHAANASLYDAAKATASGTTPPPDQQPTDRDYRVKIAGTTVEPAMLRLRIAGITTTIWVPTP